MATKKASSKKSTKKAGAKKAGAKKAAAKLSPAILAPHFICIRNCFRRYEICVRQATTPAQRRNCLLALIRCIRSCNLVQT